jgi:hypothetical protein
MHLVYFFKPEIYLLSPDSAKLIENEVSRARDNSQWESNRDRSLISKENQS